MNCEQYQEQVSQFMDGELPPITENELFAHLGTCEICRGFLKNVISLRNTITLDRQIAVPASLDRRVFERHFPITKKMADQTFIRRFRENKYSFRAIGLAIILSALTAVLISSLWYSSYKPQQTIVCLTPLPEVEVTGYVVVAPSLMKGVKQ
jgi:predicted anti-sigma-YlaC factor YlaD